MKKTILAAMSAGILSGCNSAPPLAVPKGEFIEMNTDITSLLPHTEPVYIGLKNVKLASSTKAAINSKTEDKGLSLSGKNEVDIKVKKEIGVKKTSTQIAQSIVTTKKPVPLKGFVTPVLTVATDDNHKKPIAEPEKKASSTIKTEKKPFSLHASSQPVMSALTKPSNPEVIVKTPPVKKIWEIKKGTTLITGFIEWMNKEKCSSLDGKWTLQRQTDTDYPIDYPLTFHAANFEDATTQLFNLYRKAQAPIYVSGYRNQCLIVISDKK